MRDLDSEAVSAGRSGDPQPLDDLESALARSRDIDAPIFFYWGTKWCPPCAEMQATVLQRPSFRSRCANMVALYVDGDAPGAQVCGERLDTEVYPTLILLDREQLEWIRLPCGVAEDAFGAVIDAALRRRTPMSALADALDVAARPLHEDDLTLLAHHYWPLERRVRAGAERLPFLDRLDAAAMSGAPQNKSRILCWQLVERSGRPILDTPPLIRHRLYDGFLELLHSPQATYSTLYYLLVSLEPVVAFLCENETARRELTGVIGGVLERLVDDGTLSWTERLIAQSANVALRMAPQAVGEPAPPIERTRIMVQNADATTASATERQSVMNMAGHLLRQSGLREESIRLFRAEIDRSPWPTYFMPYVAEMYMEQNDRDEAFRWWQRSYEETPGKTTRFELGVRYIAALVRHAPQERAAIERMVARLLSDRGDDADMTRARGRKSLALLARTLKGWQT
jgi:hypothetical protein